MAVIATHGVPEALGPIAHGSWVSHHPVSQRMTSLPSAWCVESPERHSTNCRCPSPLQSDRQRVCGLGDSQVRDHECVLGLRAAEERKVALPRRPIIPIMQMWKPRLRKVQNPVASSSRKDEARTSSQSLSVTVTEMTLGWGDAEWSGGRGAEWRGEGCEWEELVAGVWAWGVGGNVVNPGFLLTEEQKNSEWDRLTFTAFASVPQRRKLL